MQNCSNTECHNHLNPEGTWFVKIGYFKPKGTQKPTPRYKCKGCGKSFSTHTNKASANQKKPDINQQLFNYLVSGVSLRRASKLLKVQYNVVAEHFEWLAEQAKLKHIEHLKTIQTTYVQVDELETFLHGRPKTVSVPMVVRVKTGEILGFAVARMPTKGRIASIGISKYGWTADERPEKFNFMLEQIKDSLKPGGAIQKRWQCILSKMDKGCGCRCKSGKACSTKESSNRG